MGRYVEAGRGASYARTLTVDLREQERDGGGGVRHLVRRPCWLCPREGFSNLLSAGAAILPDVPGALVALFGPQLANVRAGDALIVAVVPFADVLGDLDLGTALET